MSDFPIVVLLVDDQPIIAEAVRRMLYDQTDITLHYCSNPAEAIPKAIQLHATVILQDLVMEEIDGLTLVRYFRANSQTKGIPLIVLSTQEEPITKAKAFAYGANDYIVKLPDPIELIARLRYHSAAYIRLLERNQAYQKLEESQRVLHAELAEAASYVTSLLPKPITQGPVSTAWSFIPSTQLGGDAFSYQWIGLDYFVFYLLDVCGHGVGAALLSISIINMLRSHGGSSQDLLDPEKILLMLNERFPMEEHNDMFFTIWYGVYDQKTRELKYASAGHPPGVLVNIEGGKKKVTELRTGGMVIGATPLASFPTATCVIPRGSQIYLFSDGIYELPKADGTILKLDEFMNIFAGAAENGVTETERILRFSRTLMGDTPFSDDVSLLEVSFN